MFEIGNLLKEKYFHQVFPVLSHTADCMQIFFQGNLTKQLEIRHCITISVLGADFDLTKENADKSFSANIDSL